MKIKSKTFVHQTRLSRISKHQVHLKSLLQNRIFGEEALRNALVEAEGVLNSRPITHVSNDAGDIEALTLNHFPCNEEAEVSEREINATKLWRQSQALVNTSFGSA